MVLPVEWYLLKKNNTTFLCACPGMCPADGRQASHTVETKRYSGVANSQRAIAAKSLEAHRQMKKPMPWLQTRGGGTRGPGNEKYLFVKLY